MVILIYPLWEEFCLTRIHGHHMVSIIIMSHGDSHDNHRGHHGHPVAWHAQPGGRKNLSYRVAGPRDRQAVLP